MNSARMKLMVEHPETLHLRFERHLGNNRIRGSILGWRRRPFERGGREPFKFVENKSKHFHRVIVYST
jgi:hypothetical protein